MTNPLQLLAFAGLAALALGFVQLSFRQYRLYRTALETAELERQYLRERIGLIADQRRLERERSETSWNGFRKFRIMEKKPESDDVCSFYLAPHDGKPLPPFQPGQYLTFQLRLPGQAKPTVRCYSLSDRPGISGPLSRHDQARCQRTCVESFPRQSRTVGDIVDVKAPAGQFCLDLHAPDSDRADWRRRGRDAGAEHVERGGRRRGAARDVVLLRRARKPRTRLPRASALARRAKPGFARARLLQFTQRSRPRAFAEAVSIMTSASRSSCSNACCLRTSLNSISAVRRR